MVFVGRYPGVPNIHSFFLVSLQKQFTPASRLAHVLVFNFYDGYASKQVSQFIQLFRNGFGSGLATQYPYP
jgi:hypothetical protein